MLLKPFSHRAEVIDDRSVRVLDRLPFDLFFEKWCLGERPKMKNDTLWSSNIHDQLGWKQWFS